MLRKKYNKRISSDKRQDRYKRRYRKAGQRASAQHVTHRKKNPDYILFFVACVLILWGIFTVATVSFPVAVEEFGTPWHYFIRQLSMLGIGIAVFFLFYKISIDKIKKVAPILFFINFILLLAIFVPKLGVSSGGASRWLSLGGIVFQPSELLKISFILYVSSWLAGRQKIKARKHLNQLLVPFAIILLAVFIVLILQPNLSTLGIIIFSGIIMYFVARTPVFHTIAFFLVGAIGAVALIFRTPYRLKRWLVFINPDKDPLGIGYQIRQARIAIGSGKLTGIGEGLGIGLSRQKFGFLPYPMTDSIFAIIGEELGFIGAIFLIVLFLVLAYRAFTIAAKSKDAFCKIAAVGITVWITTQALFNMAGIIGVAPLGGVPLPFFSFGGSHLIAEMAGLGILLNISKSA